MYIVQRRHTTRCDKASSRPHTLGLIVASTKQKKRKMTNSSSFIHNIYPFQWGNEIVDCVDENSVFCWAWKTMAKQKRGSEWMMREMKHAWNYFQFRSVLAQFSMFIHFAISRLLLFISSATVVLQNLFSDPKALKMKTCSICRDDIARSTAGGRTGNIANWSNEKGALCNESKIKRLIKNDKGKNDVKPNQKVRCILLTQNVQHYLTAGNLANAIICRADVGAALVSIHALDDVSWRYKLLLTWWRLEERKKSRRGKLLKKFRSHWEKKNNQKIFRNERRGWWNFHKNSQQTSTFQIGKLSLFVVFDPWRFFFSMQREWWRVASNMFICGKTH